MVAAKKLQGPTMNQTAEIVALKALVNFLLIGVYRDEPELIENLRAELATMLDESRDPLEIEVIGLQLNQLRAAKI